MGCSGSKKSDEEKKDEPEKPGILSRSPFYEIKHLFTIGMTIACIVLAITAYIDLSNYTSDVQDILKNWKTKPLMDIYVANYTDTCADGYSELSYSRSDFVGVSKGHCACTATSYLYSSTLPNCSSDVESTPECMSMKSLNGVNAKAWRRERICYKRGGEASVSFKDGYSRRPYPDEKGNCDDGYKICGSGTYQDDRAICFPDTEQCPITGLLVAATKPSGGSWILAGNFTHDGTHLFYRREYTDELPAVEFEDALTKYNGDYMADNYNGKKNDRGPCYMGGAQRYDNSIKVSETEFATYSLKAPSSCQKPDPRFVLYDNVDFVNHYLGVLEQSSRCTGFELYSLSDPRYQSASDPDYLKSGVPCGPTPYTCNRESDMGTNCLSNDNICDLVVNQNLCGQYVEAIRGAAKSDTFGLYRRSEIYWSPTCEVDRESIYTNKDPLQAALASQLAVVVIGCIFGILAGVIWPCALLTVLKREFCNVVNYKITIMDRADPFIHLIKIVPLIPSIYYVSKIYRLFATAGKDQCSDPTSNETFDYLAETLPSIFQKSISNIALEGAMLFAGIYFYRQKSRKAEKHFAGKVVPEEAVTNEQPPNAQPPQPAQQQPVYQMVPPQQPGPGYQMAPQGYPPQQQMAPQGYPPQQQMAPQGYPQQYPQGQGYPPQQMVPQQGYPPQQQPYGMVPQYPQQQY